VGEALFAVGNETHGQNTYERTELSADEHRNNVT